MVDKLLTLLSGSPAYLITIVLAMMPVSELRGAIPYAIGVAGMPWQEAYVISVIANFLPVIPILYLIGPVSEYLRRFGPFDRFFTCRRYLFSGPSRVMSASGRFYLHKKSG